MKYWWAIALLLPGLLLGQERLAAPASVQPITVSLPRNINPETVQIDYGFAGAGLSLGRVPMRAGVYDYPVQARSSEFGPPTSLKLLVYIPGYRMVAAEFTLADLQAGKTFIPPLVPLPTTTVKGRLIDSTGKPMAHESLKFEYSLTEQMGYFGYADGMVRTIHVADARTDDNGDFAIAVPSLFDDPFFQGSRSPGGFRISNGNQADLWDPTLSPGSFQIQKTYAPLIIRKTQKGMLTGKLGKAFLRQNNLSEDLSVYVRPRDTIVTGIRLEARLGKTASFSARLYPDGRFELQVPAGKYDIALWVSAEERSILIERDIVIEEGKLRVLELP